MQNKKTTDSISISLFLVFTIAIYAPISIYCANADEYWYTLRIIWYVPIVVAAVFFSISFLASFLSKGWLRNIILGAEFGLGLCFYLQGNFLHMTVGIFDGSYIDWSQYHGRMAVNAVVWLAIVFLCVLLFLFRSEISCKVSKYVSMMLFGIQLVSLVIMLIPVIRSQGMKIAAEPVFSTEGMYEVGNDNIIVIIVDVFDEQYMDYAKNSMEDIDGIFDGFEFYDNFTSEYSHTGLSFPCSLILGKQYHNEKDLQEWIEENGQDRLYFDDLVDNGYEFSIYTDEFSCYPTRIAEKATNYREIEKRFYNMRTCISILYRSAGCVYFPDILKPYIWLDDAMIVNTAATDSRFRPCTEDNSTFKSGLIKDSITVKPDAKQYKMIHLRGIHEPFYTDEWGDETDEHWDWKIATRGVMRILGEYFKYLKEAGVYDNSVIIVTGDHGYHHTRGALSNPAFLIKYKDSHGDIRINSNEAGLVNFAATVADVSGMADHSRYGLSLRDIDADTEFERFYYGNTYDQTGEVTTGSLLEYIIPVETNDVRQFKLTGVEYNTHGEKIDHASGCQTCIDHVEPEVMDDFHVIDLHRRAR